MLPDQIPRTLQTDRLLLRAPRQEDGPAVYRAVAASLPELRRWMVWAQQPLDEAGYTSNMAAAAEAFTARTELRYLIWDASGQELLGSTGFHALNWEVPKGEIGYWMHSAQAGKGYATEAARALTRLGFETLGFRRIEIRCDALNAPSAAIARRAGYTQDARLVNNAVATGQVHELRDTLVFSKTPSRSFNRTYEVPRLGVDKSVRETQKGRCLCAVPISAYCPSPKPYNS